MQHRKFLVFALLIFSFVQAGAQNREVVWNKKVKLNNAPNNVTVSFVLNQDLFKDSIHIGRRPIELLRNFDWHKITLGLNGGIATWSDRIEEPVSIYTRYFMKDQNAYWVVEPGDSIAIIFDGRTLQSTGPGSEKFNLQTRIQQIKDSLKQSVSNKHDAYVLSMEDYMEWVHLLKMQLDIILPLINSYRDRLSDFAFYNIRDHFLDNLIDNRTDKFSSLQAYAHRTGMSKKNICDLYDSTYAPYVTDSFLPSMNRTWLGSWGPIRLEVARKFYFDYTDKLPPSKPERRRILYQMFYQLAMKKYTGLVRENFLLEFLTNFIIDDLGFIPQAEATLKKYYAEPGYPEYKKAVKEHEMKKRLLKDGKVAPEFSLKDMEGNILTKENIRGKVALLDFWFTGCQGCVQLTPVLAKVEQAFKGNPNVVFLSISIDKNQESWLNSVRQKKYTTGSAINLYTGGAGADHETIKKYSVREYPTLYLIDALGKVRKNPLPREEKAITAAINELLAKQKDGPYVLYNDQQAMVWSVDGDTVIHARYPGSNALTLTVQTDEYGKTFNVTLKENLQTEPAEYAQPEKLLALSDIEGNFKALRKLLQANGIIDEKYNWTFGKGHLVFTGDMFDRGEQVTECLWLIYSLEEKAKAAGGYVHFILGNHEIMNLNGDVRYTKQKYLDNAEKLSTTYSQLYGKSSELGRWLRTKNIVEKIGNLLFVHGGISPEVANLPLNIRELNDLARPYYDKESIARTSSDKKIAILFHADEDKRSPFWYRCYYLDEEKKARLGGANGVYTLYKTPMHIVDSTLAKYNVTKIITGHTIAGESINAHYNGKVINIDTPHSYNLSEALLIEQDQYYRVDQTGRKVALFQARPVAANNHPGQVGN